jgi:hypothetical protein
MMKKFCIIVALFVMSTALMAQVQTQLGVGHLWSAQGSYPYAMETSQFQLQGSFLFDFDPHWSAGLSVSRDTIDVVNWAYYHNFTTNLPPAGSVNYTIFDAEGRYTFNPGDKALVYAMVGMSLYDRGGVHKGGVTAGFGLQYQFYKGLYLYVDARFRHVQNFVVPVANTVQTGLGLGWKFGK